MLKEKSIKTDYQNNQNLQSLLEQKPKPNLDDTVIIGLLAFLIEQDINQNENNNGKTS